jgi:hypothetical protein
VEGVRDHAKTLPLSHGNIRDQGSWVHQNEPEAATRRAKDQARMAVATVACQPSLQKFDLPFTKASISPWKFTGDESTLETKPR